MPYQTIGFIGAGQMARALAAGFVRAGIAAPAEILAADPVAAAREAFVAAVPGCSVTADNATALERDVVVLAVKPQQIPAVLAELRPRASNEQLVISIAAGVTLATLDAGLSAGRLVRVMPNTPCLVGMSASGYALGPRATAEDGKWVARALGSVGLAIALDEKMLDAVTGLSGSGPAYVYLLIEALADGGVLAGLPRDAAAALAAQTVRGAAEMVLATGEHPAVLKDRVASPGGTTIAGLEVLESAGFRSALVQAVKAATNRSAELGRKSAST
jgi:pyrroline-5-carboxylate reductase